MKVEPYWDAQKFSLLFWLFIANEYCTDSGLLFCGTELSHTDEKTVSANVTQICPKKIVLVPTILLSSTVKTRV